MTIANTLNSVLDQYSLDIILVKKAKTLKFFEFGTDNIFIVSKQEDDDSMRFILKFCIIVVSILTLSGCGSYVISDVAVFHQLPQKPDIKTYTFLPLEWQENNLEYNTYKDLIKNHLLNYQYVEVTGNEIPDVIISFYYSIDDGREKLESVPVFGRTGVKSSTTHGTINTYKNYGVYSGTTTYTPTYGVVGSYTESNTEYSRELYLYIANSKSAVRIKPKSYMRAK